MSWKNWMKKSYRATPTEGSETRMVKFSDIHNALTQQFPSTEINTQSCKSIVDDLFPKTNKFAWENKEPVMWWVLKSVIQHPAQFQLVMYCRLRTYNFEKLSVNFRRGLENWKQQLHIDFCSMSITYTADGFLVKTW